MKGLECGRICAGGLNRISFSEADLMPQQRWLRIIPVALIMYMIAFIDRTNVSMALPSLSRDLHMDPIQAGNIAGVFSW